MEEIFFPGVSERGEITSVGHQKRKVQPFLNQLAKEEAKGVLQEKRGMNLERKEKEKGCFSLLS